MVVLDEAPTRWYRTAKLSMWGSTCSGFHEHLKLVFEVSATDPKNVVVSST